MMRDSSLEIKLDKLKIDALNVDFSECLLKTAEVLKSDVVNSQTMPLLTGTMQNESTYSEKDGNGSAFVRTNTPYARRLYYHPEYKFRREPDEDSNRANPKAGALWLEPYIDGNKKELAQEKFMMFLKQKGV